MKTKTSISVLAGLCLLAVSCTTGGDGGDYGWEKGPYDGYALSDGGTSGDGSGAGGNTQAGIVTAGEWRDLDHWGFWSQLMQGTEYAEQCNYWQFFTNNRVAVRVKQPGGQPLAGVAVELLWGGTSLWHAVTDNHGEAECWVGLFQPTKEGKDNLTVKLNGREMDGHPQLCPWDSLAVQTRVNDYVLAAAPTVKKQADIAFVVDATGSMSDEINFLKSDLTDIMAKVAQVRPDMKMRTAALFYRDESDEYLTRHHDFSDDASQTVQFVSQQRADGGGDYPEAVHSALEHTLQDLSWDAEARSRLAFLILDAPAHHQGDIILSLQRSVQQCARQGIRLIPVAASGVDKNTEFMLRFFAISTGGTYVFLTNDSGVGNDHLVPTVGDYEVELLNSLLIRLISYYTE